VGLADRGVKVPRGAFFKGETNMPALIDMALAVTIFIGAFFLGTVGLALFRELTNKDKNDDNHEPR